MLRRRSEFFVFLDGMRSKPEEEQKEERPQSACEEYLQVLLQMKMTSSVSQQDLLMQNSFNAFSKQLNPSTFSARECVTDFPSSHSDSQHRSNFLLLTLCNKDVLASRATPTPSPHVHYATIRTTRGRGHKQQTCLNSEHSVLREWGGHSESRHRERSSRRHTHS